MFTFWFERWTVFTAAFGNPKCEHFPGLKAGKGIYFCKYLLDIVAKLKKNLGMNLGPIGVIDLWKSKDQKSHVTVPSCVANQIQIIISKQCSVENLEDNIKNIMKFLQRKKQIIPKQNLCSTSYSLTTHYEIKTFKF